MIRTKGHSKKAFTLVEMIVVIAIVGIVGVAVASMMVASSNVFSFMSQDVAGKMKAAQVMKVVLPQVQYADSLAIQADHSAAGANGELRYLYSDGGRIYINESGSSKELFSADFYENYSVVLSAVKIENNLLEITVTVTYNNDASIKSEIVSATRALNTEDITGQQGTCLAYKWKTF